MIATFLETLHTLGIQLSIHNDTVKVDAVKGVLTPDIVEQIKNKKHDILDFYRASALVARDKTIQSIPATHAQQRFWFLSQMTSNKIAYNIQLALEINGIMDKKALRFAFLQLIERHESLRTVFEWTQEGILMQHVLPFEAVNMPIYYDEVESIQKTCDELTQQLFNLRTGPLLSCHVLIHNNQHVLCLNIHHIAADGLSMAILREEWMHYYKKSATLLAPVHIQYPDYALWLHQHDACHRIKEQKQVDYWKEQLRGFQRLSLPIDYASVDENDYTAGHQRFDLTSEDSLKIQALTRSSRTTPFHIFLAVLNVVIAHYCHQEDMVIGTPVSGRYHEKIEKTVGCFINTIVIRTVLDKTMHFSELLEKNKNTLLDALNHQNIPFEQLISAVEPVRKSNENPIFQVFYSYDITKALNLYIKPPKTHYDVSVYVSQHEKNFSITLEYKTALFSDNTIEKIINSYTTFLHLFLKAPFKKIGDFYDTVKGQTPIIQTITSQPTRYFPPNTIEEKLLTSLWENEFNAALRTLSAPIGLQDNFFDLGGDSIIAMHIVSKLAQSGYSLSPSHIFEQQTVALIATCLIKRKTDISNKTLNSSAKCITLSPLQEGMLFHTLYEPLGYHIQLSFSIEGPLIPTLYKKAWEIVFDRHAILRHGFMFNEDNKPVQFEKKDIVFPWSDDPSLIAFDLAQPPLMRCTLMDKHNHHQFIWTFHHILLDGWSISLVLDEVSVIYHQLAEGITVAHSVIPPTYTHYIQWLQSQNMESAKCYWKNRLNGIHQGTSLDLYKPSKNQQKTRISKELSIENSDNIIAFSKKNGVTLSALLHTLWGVILTFYAGKHDLLFGSITSGRPPALPNIDAIIGLFINTIPVRANFNQEDKLIDLIQNMNIQLVQSRDYEYCSLNNIKHWLNIHTQEMLFDTLFIFENYPAKNSLSGKSRIHLTHFSMTEQTNYPLTIVSEYSHQQIKVHVDFVGDSFSEKDKHQITEHYLQLIQTVETLASKKVHELPSILPENQMFFDTINQTNMPLSHVSDTLYQQFTSHVINTPQKTALTYQEKSLTYQALAENIHKIAKRLAYHGVQYGDRVGLYAERSLEMLISIMAILRLGAAYIPLDPKYPKERLHTILNDSSPKLILSTLQEKNALDYVWVSYDEKNLNKTSDGIILPPYNGITSDTCYIIYTSGSTGKPKGVEITHANVLNYIAWFSDTFSFNASSVMDFSSSLSFDLSVTATLLPLVVGGSIVVCQEDTKWQIEAYLQYLNTHHITHLKCTPSFFSCLLAEPQRIASLNTLEYIILGGEAMIKSDLKTWFSYNKRQKFVNEYGPTEATVATVAYTVDHKNIDQYGEIIPIGKPAYNTQLYIFDSAHRLCPPGVSGELYIAGANVARGYFNNPALTNERFYNNCYKTGDRARWHWDGELIYEGRMDEQIKLRGFRIETDEIIGCLKQYPSIQQAAVLLHSLPNGSSQLVGFLCVTDLLHDTNAIKHYLAEKLPEYMIPAQLFCITALPLTMNGKLDKATLLAMIDKNEPANKQEILKHDTDLQQKLRHLWAELLAISPEKINLQGNFFEMGGDSITSIQLMAKAKQHNLLISPRMLFEHPSIEKLAFFLENNQKKQPTLYWCEQHTVEGKIALTPIQQLFFNEMAGNVHHYHQSFSFKISNDVSADRLFAAFSAILKHHDALRMRFFKQKNHYIQINQGLAAEKKNPSCQFHTYNLSKYDNTERITFITKQNAQLQTAINIEKGPLIQIAFYQGNPSIEKSTRVFIAIHHLIIDGVSWRILIDDWAAAYKALSAERAIALPAKTTSWRQWSQLLHHYTNHNIQQEEFDFWNAQVNNTTHQDSSTFRTARDIVVALSPTETSQLLQETLKFYHAHINEILLSALVMAFKKCHTHFYQFSHQLSIDLEGHGREDIIPEANLSRTIGWFTSIFPVNFVIPEHLNMREFIEIVKLTLNSIPHKGIGFGLLKYLSKKRFDHHAAPSIGFNYLGQFLQGNNEENLFQFSNESPSHDVSPDTKRTHSIDINAIIQEKLVLYWTYSSTLYHEKTMKQLANAYIESLQEIIHYSQHAIMFNPYQTSEFKRLKNEALIPIHVHKNSPTQRISFFCVHPGGGTVERYITLAKSLQPINFYALQDPSVLDLGRGFDSIETMAQCYIQAIQTVQPQGPYYIGGWSYGAIVAYEMAYQLRQAGYDIALLILLDGWHLPIDIIDVDEFDESVYRDLMRRGGITVSDELVKSMQLSQRQRAIIKKAYHFPKTTQDIVLFKSQEISETSPFYPYQSPHNRWREVTSGNIYIHEISGDHFNLMNTPHVDILAEKLTKLLEKTL